MRRDGASMRAGVEEAVEVGAEHGRPWAPYAMEARSLGSIVAYVQGDWEASLAFADVSASPPPPVVEALMAASRLAVLVARGDERAVELDEASRPWWDLEGINPIAATPMIDWHGDRGDVAAAVAAHDAIVTSVLTLWQRESVHAQVRMAAVLLGQLAASDEPLSRALDPEQARRRGLEPVNYDEAGFRYALNADAMATEKLAEGIRAFAADAVKLEQLMKEA